MAKKRVFIMGGDRGGWALDTEARLARLSLSRIPSLELVDSLHQADIVHTVWPEQLLEDPACGAVLRGPRPVVASFSNDPWALFERVSGLFSFARGWTCVAQSTKARRQLEALGIPRVGQVAYCADFEKFPVREFTREERQALRRKWKLPESAFLVASFQRDTEGADLHRMKAQKAPDLFRALLVEAQKRLGRGALHVVLGGPRRHWLREELRRFEIPFTFVGRETPGDDYPWQSLPARDVAELLAASDLNLVTSRWEGGPRALMECAALGIPVLSTDEGIASDLLEPASIFRSLPEGVEKLAGAARGGLASTVAPQRERLEKNHAPDSIHLSWASIYERVEPGHHASSFLRDYPVHHPRLHRWLRRAKSASGKARETLGLGRALRVLEVNSLDDPTRSAAESGGVFAAFPCMATWCQALALGWKPACPGVIRPVVPAPPAGGDAVVCLSGKGPAGDEELARRLGAAIPEHKFLAFGAAPGALLVTESRDPAPVRAAIAGGTPVVHPPSEALHEIAGYAGVWFASPDDLVATVRMALQFRNGRSLSAWLPGETEKRAALAAIRRLGVAGGSDAR